MSVTKNFYYQEDGEMRLDKYLVIKLPSLSRSRLQSLIKDGLIEVDGQKVLKNGYHLSSAMEIFIEIPDVVETTLIPEDIPLDVIFESDDVLIVNKAAGMVVHPAVGHSTGTLVHAALAHAPQMEGVGGEHRPGVVHRLDKDTSGLILMAKNDRTHHFLQEQFRSRTVKKTYLAICDGNPPTAVGRIEAPIGRDPSHRKKMAIVPLQRGRSAVTLYRVRDSYKHHSVIEAQPLTGRTHQIRLHFAFLECPIVGDSIYGHRHPTLSVDRHMLHAYKIEILLPGEQSARLFEAPIPADMQAALLELHQH